VHVLERLRRAIRELLEFVRGVDRALLEESVSALEGEYLELEYAFLVAVLGPLVGVRTITPLLSLELLDTLRGELRVLASRAFRGEDVLGDLMSALGGEW
jgi:hypothetical protein